MARRAGSAPMVRVLLCLSLLVARVYTQFYKQGPATADDPYYDLEYPTTYFPEAGDAWSEFLPLWAADKPFEDKFDGDSVTKLSPCDEQGEAQNVFSNYWDENGQELVEGAIEEVEGYVEEVYEEYQEEKERKREEKKNSDKRKNAKRKKAGKKPKGVSRIAKSKGSGKAASKAAQAASRKSAKAAAKRTAKKAIKKTGKALLKGLKLATKLLGPVGGMLMDVGIGLAMSFLFPPPPPPSPLDKYNEIKCFVDYNIQFKLKAAEARSASLSIEDAAKDLAEKALQLEESSGYEMVGGKAKTWLNLLEEYNKKAEAMLNTLEVKVDSLANNEATDLFTLLPHYASVFKSLRKGRILAYYEKHSWESSRFGRANVKAKEMEALLHNQGVIEYRAALDEMLKLARDTARRNVGVSMDWGKEGGWGAGAGWRPPNKKLEDYGKDERDKYTELREEDHIYLAKIEENTCKRCSRASLWPWSTGKYDDNDERQYDFMFEVGRKEGRLFGCKDNACWWNPDKISEGGLGLGYNGGPVHYGTYKDIATYQGQLTIAYLNTEGKRVRGFLEGQDSWDNEKPSMTSFIKSVIYEFLAPGVIEYIEGEIEKDTKKQMKYLKPIAQKMFGGRVYWQDLQDDSDWEHWGSTGLFGGDEKDEYYSIVARYMPSEFNWDNLMSTFMPRLMKYKGVSPEYSVARFKAAFGERYQLLRTYPQEVPEQAVVCVGDLCLESPDEGRIEATVPLGPRDLNEFQFWGVMRMQDGSVKLQSMDHGGLCLAVRDGGRLTQVTKRTIEVGGLSHGKASDLLGWGMECPARYAISSISPPVAKYKTTILGGVWDYTCSYVGKAKRTQRMSDTVAKFGDVYENKFGKGGDKTYGRFTAAEAKLMRSPNCADDEVMQGFKLVVKDESNPDAEEIAFEVTCLDVSGKSNRQQERMVSGGVSQYRDAETDEHWKMWKHTYQYFRQHLGSGLSSSTPGRDTFLQGLARYPHERHELKIKVYYRTVSWPTDTRSGPELAPCMAPASKLQLDALPLRGQYQVKTQRQFRVPMHLQMMIDSQCLQRDVTRSAEHGLRIEKCDRWVLDGPLIRRRDTTTCLKSENDGGVVVAPCPDLWKDYAALAAPDNEALDKEYALRAADARFFWVLLEGVDGQAELRGSPRTAVDGKRAPAEPLERLLGTGGQLRVRVSEAPMHMRFAERYIVAVGDRGQRVPGLASDPSVPGTEGRWEWHNSRIRVFDSAAGGAFDAVDDVECLVVDTAGPSLVLVKGTDPRCQWDSTTPGPWVFSGILIWDETYCVSENNLNVRRCADMSREADFTKLLAAVPEASGGQGMGEMYGYRVDGNTGSVDEPDLWLDYWCARSYFELAPWTKVYLTTLGFADEATWEGNRNRGCARPGLGEASAEQLLAAAALGIEDGPSGGAAGSGAGGPPGPPGAPGCTNRTVPPTLPPPTPQPPATPATPEDFCDDVSFDFETPPSSIDWVLDGPRRSGWRWVTGVADGWSLAWDASPQTYALQTAMFRMFSPSKPQRMSFYENHCETSGMVSQLLGPGSASCLDLGGPQTITEQPRRVHDHYLNHFGLWFKYTLMFDWTEKTVDVYRATADRNGVYTHAARMFDRQPLLCSSLLAMSFECKSRASIDNFMVACRPDVPSAFQMQQCPDPTYEDVAVTIYPAHGASLSRGDRLALVDGDEATCAAADNACGSTAACWDSREDAMASSFNVAGGRGVWRLPAGTTRLRVGAVYRICHAAPGGQWVMLDDNVTTCAPPAAVGMCEGDLREGFEVVEPEGWELLRFAEVQERGGEHAYVARGRASLNVTHGAAVLKLPSPIRPQRMSVMAGGMKGSYDFTMFMGREDRYGVENCLPDFAKRILRLEDSPIWDRHDMYFDWVAREMSVYSREVGTGATTVKRGIPMLCDAVSIVSFFGSGHLDAFEMDCSDANADNRPAHYAYPSCPMPKEDDMTVEFLLASPFEGTHTAHVVPSSAACSTEQYLAVAHVGAWPAAAGEEPGADTTVALSVGGTHATVTVTAGAPWLREGTTYKVCYKRWGVAQGAAEVEGTFTTCEMLRRGAMALQSDESDLLNPPRRVRMSYTADMKARGRFVTGDDALYRDDTHMRLTVSDVPQWLEGKPFRYLRSGLPAGSRLSFACPDAGRVCYAHMYLALCDTCNYSHVLLARSAAELGWTEGGCGPTFTHGEPPAALKYTVYRKMIPANTTYDALQVPEGYGVGERTHGVVFHVDYDMHECGAIRDAWNCSMLCAWDESEGTCVDNWCPRDDSRWWRPYSKPDPHPTRFIRFPPGRVVRGNKPTNEYTSGFQPTFAATCPRRSLNYRDGAVTDVACGRREFTRLWEVRCFADNATSDDPGSVVLARPQRFTVLPASDLTWAAAPVGTLTVPYYADLEAVSNVPIVQSPPGTWCSEVTLRSEDSDMHIFGLSSDEAQCTTDGLARFKRKWIAEDNCCRTTEFVQNVTILHPTSPRPLASNVSTLLTAPGVRQAGDECWAEKVVALGTRAYDPFDRDGDACLGERDCLLDTTAAQPPVIVAPVVPMFVEVPARVRVASAAHVMAVAQPNVTAFCGMPYEVTRRGPVQVSDREWRVEWRVRPQLLACPGPYPERLTHTRAQLIEVDSLEPHAQMSVGWCARDADCRTLGDAGATCDLAARACRCSDPDYTGVANPDGTVARVCAPRDPQPTAKTPLVVGAEFPTGDCIMLLTQPGLAAAFRAVFAAVLGVTPLGLATTCGASSLAVSAHGVLATTDVPSVEAMQERLSAAMAAVPELSDVAGTGMPRVASATVMDPSEGCQVAAAADTALVTLEGVTSCNALRCTTGHVKAMRAGRQVCVPVPADDAGVCAVDHDCTAGGAVSCVDGVCEGYARPSAGGRTVTYVSHDDRPWLVPVLIATAVLAVVVAGGLLYVVCNKEYQQLMAEEEAEGTMKAAADGMPDDEDDIAYRCPDSPVVSNGSRAVVGEEDASDRHVTSPRGAAGNPLGNSTAGAAFEDDYAGNMAIDDEPPVLDADAPVAEESTHAV